MDCLVGYGSDDENESERYGSQQPLVAAGGSAARRRDDDTNYDDVNMDMSEDSQDESEPELPQAEPTPHPHSSREERPSIIVVLDHYFFLNVVLHITLTCT
ncbi:hypothetical protein HF086_018264 [Spodoptera exigua]|uniref:Uncharacterized protein n=1 Tax=Spodoptera exigua TaxID=7107 RepID=A0A922MYI1_SPOEX|nr:hypothetical protein HF086_018264 [Spodoptera exigua]